MKISTCGALVALVGLAWSAAPARADDPAVHKELQDIYNEVVDGLKKKDPVAAQTYVAPDYVEHDQFGKTHTREQLAEAMRKAMDETVSVGDIRMDVQRVVVHGEFAVALVNRHVATTIKDPKGTTHPFTSDAVALDFWDKTPDGWRLKRTHGVSLQQTLDGKAMHPGARRHLPAHHGPTHHGPAHHAAPHHATPHPPAGH